MYTRARRGRRKRVFESSDFTPTEMLVTHRRCAFFPSFLSFLFSFLLFLFSSFSHQPLFLSCEVPRRVNRGQYGQTDLSVLYIRIAELKHGEQPRHTNRSRTRVLVSFLFLASLRNLRVACIGTVASGRTIVTYRLNKTRWSYALSIHLR